jgi:hypothetical protein
MRYAGFLDSGFRLPDRQAGGLRQNDDASVGILNPIENKISKNKRTNQKQTSIFNV